ncbi:MAG: Swt1 family HEPN domain-containing protein [Candidatus Odinarchaeota archaeon]
MAEVYFNLFIFENRLRDFIEEVSIKSYGNNYWKELKINKRIGTQIKNRKKDENLYKWLPIRGDSDIYYTDFDDLRVIISSNWKIFQPYFPKENWIIIYLEDLYKIRNKIAHNIPIEEDERNTVKTLLNNIYSRLEIDLKYINLFSEDIPQSIQYYREDEEESEKISKTMEQKNLEVTIYEPLLLDTNKQYIAIKAVNKGLRPILITNYGFRSVKHGSIIFIYDKKLVKEHLFDELPKKLANGEACDALYPKKKFELSMKSSNWKYPFKLQAFFNTNDGTYVSEPYTLWKELSLDANMFHPVNHEKSEENK